MIWLGIGVLVIGIAFLILVLVLIKPLSNLANVLNSVQETTDALPEKLDTITNQTSEIMNQTNQTLQDVNVKMAELTPMFQIIGNAGRASEELTYSLVNTTRSMKNTSEEGEDITSRTGLKGISGGIAFGYYIFKKRKALKDTIDNLK